MYGRWRGVHREKYRWDRRLDVFEYGVYGVYINKCKMCVSLFCKFTPAKYTHTVHTTRRPTRPPPPAREALARTPAGRFPRWRSSPTAPARMRSARDPGQRLLTGEDPSDEFTRLIYAPKEIRGCLEAESRRLPTATGLAVARYGKPQ